MFNLLAEKLQEKIHLITEEVENKILGTANANNALNVDSAGAKNDSAPDANTGLNF